MWTYAWNEVAKIEQHGNSIKFKEPATRILFGFLPGAEQTAYMHTKEMADVRIPKRTKICRRSFCSNFFYYFRWHMLNLFKPGRMGRIKE